MLGTVNTVAPRSMRPITVDCPAGTVTGIDDGDTHRFHSIEYSLIGGPFDDAAPRPGGQVIDATHPRPEAVALSVTTPSGTKALADLPVIVYIHGGRYEKGSHTDPRADGGPNAARGIITVQIGYRIKLPGFVRFHDDPDSHYRGIDDCQLGLEWVQANIESFGGDPTNVTLVGQSAGAATAMWLSRKDHYRGAFRRVLAASPSFPRNSFESRKWLLRQTTGLPITRDTLDRWQRNNPQRLERGYKRFRFWLGLGMALGPFPIDPKLQADVPIVVTSTADEFYTMPGAANLDKIGLGTLGVRIMGRMMGVRHVRTWLRGARAMDPKHVAGRLVGDVNTRRWVLQIAEETPGPLWMVEFTEIEGQPALHSREIRPLFGVIPSTIHDWLVNFATTGEPGFPQYHEGRQALRVNLHDGTRTPVVDPLGYIRDTMITVQPRRRRSRKR